jgi:uncharacterized membrane protein YqjE
MTLREKIARWRMVRNFCTQRFVDYGELFGVELAEAKARLLHEVIALVALTIGALFALSFISIAVIVTAFGTPHLVLTAWCVAGAWLAVAVIAAIVIVSRKPGEPFRVLRDQLQRDAEAIKEVMQ